jgi:tetratricopeptide (TPR) repeat protein
MKRACIFNIALSGLVVAVGFLCLTFTAFAQHDNNKTNTPAGKPLNEQTTADAWDAYNSGKYQAAITNAEICIEEFRGAASLLQTKLEKEKPELPTGAVSDDVKKKIQANGLLNDVATCYFIKGRSAEKLGRKDEALKTYEQVKKYTYARTWDPQGWFWSPAEAAEGRIEGLR